MTTTEERIAAIRKALEAGPTPGEWKTQAMRTDGLITRVVGDSDVIAGLDGICEPDRNNERTFEESRRNMDFIAACNTVAMTAVLSELDRLKEENERMRVALESAFAAMPKPEPVGCVSEMPGSNGGFTMSVFRATDVPLGSNLYLAPPSPAVIVKALEWKQFPNQHGVQWRAQGIFGWLHYISDRDDDGHHDGWFHSVLGTFATLEAAKAAAQADYEARILSALNTSPEAPRHD